MRKKLILFTMAAFVSLLPLSGCNSAGDDDVIRLKMGLIDPESSNYGQGALQIAEEVRIATGGKIEIEVYAGGKLGNERDMYEGSMLGTIDICTVANPVMSSFIPEMAVLDQPFLFADTGEAHAAIDGRLGELIAAKAEVQGVHIVGWMESGFRNIFSTKPITSHKDFKSLKIRTMENNTHITAFNAMGAIATPMASGEQYTALQQGTIDAVENATSNMLVNKFYEITKHHTQSNHIFVFIGIGVSDHAWDKIPDDLKPVFVDAVKRGCEAQRELLVQANEEATKQLAEKGVQFHSIDTNELSQIVEPYMEPFKQKIPPEWQEAILEAKEATP